MPNLGSRICVQEGDRSGRGTSTLHTRSGEIAQRTKNGLLFGAVAVVAFLLAGCQVMYTAPQEGLQAQLHIFSKNAIGEHSGWFYFRDQQCTDKSSTLLGGFSSFYDPNKIVSLAAEKSGYLVVSTTKTSMSKAYSCGSLNCVAENTCTVQFKMSPQAGRKYLAQYKPSSSYCDVMVVDAETGAAVPEVQQIPVAQGCLIQ